MPRTEVSTHEAWALGERPGFLIRRLHQIHVALFARRCGRFGVTPVQFSLMSALGSRGVADQTMLAADVALDRTTATGALKRLEDNGLTRRVASAADRRARLWSLSARGVEVLDEMQASVREAHDETIAALSPAERETFIRLLGRLVKSEPGGAGA